MHVLHPFSHPAGELDLELLMPMCAEEDLGGLPRSSVLEDVQAHFKGTQ